MNSASKVIVITGASPGVGRATAWRFAKDGEEIALLSRGRDGTIAATIVFLALSKIQEP